jgi:hypothetical protein
VDVQRGIVVIGGPISTAAIRAGLAAAAQPKFFVDREGVPLDASSIFLFLLVYLSFYYILYFTYLAIIFLNSNLSSFLMIFCSCGSPRIPKSYLSVWKPRTCFR